MEAHTPKRHAIEHFIKEHSGDLKGWQVRVIDEKDNPVVRLEATRPGHAAGEPGKTLEIHTRQATVDGDEIDHATQTMIRKWISAL